MTIPVPDPGLQPERTALSWTRTALAMLVCSMVLLRWSHAYPVPVFGAIGLLLTLATVLISRYRRLYRTEAHNLAQERSQPNTISVFATAVALVALGGLGLWLVLAQ
ncbi:hypothetical protein BJP05_00525 [Corynebacterium sp. NML98-0116]|uniref:DUF202 domain-containing protein n=1 Tax=Corynebacterium sp. NML98-0116 TaxID=702967 RepID=UPI0008787B02|nr:DUF202 domain-containing protein [Corynebacterium sp. NML98-0116]AOX04832.1 hypothetical protein BJP05_00525 [Corynebacterium sp. NML98-0116]